jgi:hypothetical protein
MGGSSAGLADDVLRGGGGLGDDLAGAGRYGGAGYLGDDLRVAGGFGDDLGGSGRFGGAGRAGDDLAGAGLRRGRLGSLGAADEGLPAGDLLEAAFDVTVEIVALGDEEESGDDEHGQGDEHGTRATGDRHGDGHGSRTGATQTLAEVDPQLRELWLQIATRDPTLIVATPASGYDATGIERTLARAGGSTPVGVLGVTYDGGETLRLSTSESIATKDLHLACIRATRSCVVLACDGEPCARATETFFAALARDARSRAVVLRTDFERAILRARAAARDTAQLVISRLELPPLGPGGFRGTPSIVRSRPDRP